MLSNQAHPNVPGRSTRQLNPIQIKKTTRPPSQRTAIDCETPPINNSNNLKNEYKDVYMFLKDLNMDNYLEVFINNGINTEEKLLYLNNDNLKLINIPYAHRARFLKKLKEIETIQKMKKSITEKGGLSKIKLKKIEKNVKYEEIIMPKEEDDIDVGDEEMRTTFEQAIFDFQKTHNNFHNPDIRNNNNEFFSTGISHITNITHLTKESTNRYSEIKEDASSSNKIIDNNEIKLNKNENKEKLQENKIEDDNKSQKSEGVGDTLDAPIEIGEYIENKNLEVKKYDIPTKLVPECPRIFFPLNKQKTLCYNCLHMILQEHCINKFTKPFCSLRCLEIFEQKNVTICNSCGKKIEIINSIPSALKEKIYYCSPECLQKKEPNENLIINQSQIMGKNRQNSVSPSSSEGTENVIDILDL